MTMVLRFDDIHLELTQLKPCRSCRSELALVVESEEDWEGTVLHEPHCPSLPGGPRPLQDFAKHAHLTVVRDG